ncbi:putative Cytochrome P450 oxidoreductase [Fonsecaea pedrosoi]|nr:putative Cytochrome P450 oxidoreductase [Fonsecaea pedrosoi]
MAGPSIPPFILYGLALTVVVFAALKLCRVGMRPKDFPPGPRTVPILGNLHQFPLKDMHLQFQKWTQEYGPLVGLQLGTQRIILLGSASAVHDLLEKRSANNSTRMDILFREYGNDLNIFFRPYDDVWKRQRKVYHVRLNSKLANNYLPYQYFETAQLLHDLLETPDDFRHHFERFTISIGATIAYGKRFPSADIREVKILTEWFRRAVIAGASLQLADWWPVLRPIIRAVPYRINPLKRYLGELERMEVGLWKTLVDETRDHIQKGRYYPSLCRDMILSNEKGKDQLSERELWYNSGHAWAAATDTQSNTLLGFVKAMVLFPEVQSRARSEIDSVVGATRLPEWTDRGNMPYLRRCVEETLRWQPTTLTGGPMPHASMKDDVYMGYSIPAGTGLMNCVWTINNDPTRYDNPRDFNPERFPEEESGMDAYSITQNYEKRPHLTFGAGRRVCPGSHVADRTLFITMARLLWAFEFHHKLDAQGVPILVERDALTEGLVVGPAPFQCTIKPRSEDKVDIIRKLYQDTAKELDQWGNYTEEFFKENWTAADLK